MKCIICHNKFPTKHIQRCSKLPRNICTKCSIEGNGSHSCDLSCSASKFPKIKSYPLSDGVVGMNPAGEEKITTEEFMPRALHFISCEVLQVNIHMSNIFLLEVSADFKLKGNPSLTKSIYEDEYWKLTHIESAFKKGLTDIKFPVAPVFSIFIDGHLRVIPESVELKIDGRNRSIFLNDTPELIGLPDCYPPLTELPKPLDENYSYFSGKFSVFYAPFELERIYNIKFNIEAVNFFYITGLLFPYRFVDIKSFNVSSSATQAIPRKMVRAIYPLRLDKFPPKQEYEWDRKRRMELRPPWMNRAYAFRDQPLIGLYQKPQMLTTENVTNISLHDYAIFGSRLFIALPQNKEFIAKVETTTSPLPVRIYEQLQSLPKYRDFLIAYDLINLSKNPLELELVSKINGYTNEAIDNVTIPPIGSSESARIIQTQCPKLKRGILGKVVKATEATLTYKIIKRNNGKRVLLERGSRTIKLLPEDVMIWSIKDPKGSTYYDLAKMLCAWVTATDEKRMLDKIRGNAKEFHPDKVLVGQQGVEITLDEITTQVRALYDFLNKKSGIRYVNQPFTFDFNSGGQRVLTPENVITTKAGNCIDLVILFASLMEGLGLNPLILLTKSHAFLGWGNKYSKDMMGFLECTCLGRVNPKTRKKFTFDEAQGIAKETYLKEFIKIGADDYIPLHSVVLSPDEPQIIDLSEVRKEGVHRAH